MIKKWAEFIKEDLDMDNTSYLDTKMQEIKDMLANIADGKTLIYEWENKNDHELSISFTTDALSIKYEFDIDDLTVSKVVGDTVDFTSDVDSVDKGIEVIEKDIHSIIGIEEKLFGKEMFQKEFGNYPEHIMIYINILDDVNVFIKNSWMDKKVNRFLMKYISDKFNLNFTNNEASVNRLDVNKVDLVDRFFVEIGLERSEYKLNKSNKITYKGKMSVKELKKKLK